MPRQKPHVIAAQLVSKVFDREMTDWDSEFVGHLVEDPLWAALKKALESEELERDDRGFMTPAEYARAEQAVKDSIPTDDLRKLLFSVREHDGQRGNLRQHAAFLLGVELGRRAGPAGGK